MEKGDAPTYTERNKKSFEVRRSPMRATYQKSDVFATESFGSLQEFVEEASRRPVDGRDRGTAPEAS